MGVAAAALATVTVLTGCGAGDGDVVAQAPPTADPSGEWLSTAVTERGEPRSLVPGTRVGLTFGDGRLSANAGCNSMSGPVSFADGRLKIEELATTGMGCPGGGRHEQDDWLAKFLAEEPAYTYADGLLDLTTSSTHIELGPRELVEPDLPLEGTAWRITHLTSGPPPGEVDPGGTASASSPGPAEGDLRFTDGKVRGNAGCATFSGPAEVGEASVEVGPLEVARSGCSGRAAAGADHVVGVLAGAVTYRTSPHTLTLTHASGRGLQLEAVEDAGPSARPSPGRAERSAAPSATPS